MIVRGHCKHRCVPYIIQQLSLYSSEYCGMKTEPNPSECLFAELTGRERSRLLRLCAFTSLHLAVFHCRLPLDNMHPGVYLHCSQTKLWMPPATICSDVLERNNIFCSFCSFWDEIQIGAKLNTGDIRVFVAFERSAYSALWNMHDLLTELKDITLQASYYFSMCGNLPNIHTFHQVQNQN